MKSKLSRDQENASGIYTITCSGDSRIYIGSTANFKRRHYEHCSYYRYGYLSANLKDLADRFGFESFTFEVLELCDDKLNLKTMEQFYLNFFYDRLLNHKKIAVRNHKYDCK